MQLKSQSSDRKKPNRSGVGFLIRFESKAELRKVRKLAAVAQAEQRKQMGKRFPNVSQYIVGLVRKELAVSGVGNG